MNISKFRSISLPRPHPTMTTKGALKRAVWIDGPRQWNSAKFIWLSLFEVIRSRRKETRQWQFLPGFVNGCKMLCSLFYQRNQYQSHKVIRHASLNNMADLEDQEHGVHTDAGDSDCNC